MTQTLTPKVLIIGAAVMAVTLGAAAPVEACGRRDRGFRPPVSEAEQQRLANERLVSVSGTVMVAEVTAWRVDEAGAPEALYRPVAPVRGDWPVEIRTDEFVIHSCGPQGNYGRYVGAKIGDRVLLFLVSGTIFHAELLGTPRASELMAIISRDSQ